MCGIAGFVDKRASSEMSDRQKAREIKELDGMVKALRHRGPDGEGSEVFHFEGTGQNSLVGLGHSRLSILDLSKASSQPFVSECGHYHLTYNGEIYNYKEIRAKLKKQGHRFRSEGDTEVLLRSVMEWGIGAVDRFIGMFAFCFTNLKSGKVYLVRDRVGIKPLYYATQGKLFLYASELKGLVCHRDFVRALNVKVIPTYMQCGTIAEPETIYNDAYALPPACMLTFDLHRKGNARDSITDVRAYWSPTEGSKKKSTKASLEKNHSAKKTQQEVEADVEELLASACQYRMISDVPVGVFLSGGIDSSLVAILLRQKLGYPLKTFSIGFENDLYDEAPFAKQIATYLKTDHFEHYLTEQDAKEIIPSLPDFYDQPYADSSAIPTLFLSRFTRKHVSVALCGDGGDELFVGYEKYRVAHRLLTLPTWQSQILKLGLMSVKSLSIKQIIWFWRRLAFILGEPPTNLEVKLEKLSVLLRSKSGSKSSLEYFDPYFDPIPPYMATSIFHQDVLRDLNVIDVKSIISKNIKRYFSSLNLPENYLANESMVAIEKMSLVDFTDYLVNDLLVKVDRATMSVGLEGREPFLDHRLVEYVFNLSKEQRVAYDEKTHSYQPKSILKNILRRYLPEELWKRPKQGFGIPLDEWMRGDLKPFIDKYLSPRRLRATGIFNVEVIEKNKERFLSKRFNNFNMIWSLVQFEMWKEKWLD